MNKFLKIFILTIIISSYALAGFYSIKVSGGRLRKAPNMNAEIIWDMEKGYPLYAIKQQGDWYYVTDYMGYKGWVHKVVLSKRRSVIVNKIKVNLRKGPSTRYKRIGKAYNGQIFWLSRQTRNWARIINKNTGKISWVYKPLIWGD